MLTIIDIVVNLVSLVTGFRKTTSSLIARIMFVADVILTVVTSARLGWFAGLLVGGGTLLGVMVIGGVRLAFQYDNILNYAATQAVDATPAQMKALATRLRQSGEVFHVLGIIRIAQIISYLAQRGRDIGEIEQMAPAIATLWVIYEPELEPFAIKFDRLLRLWGKPASESMAVADLLTSGSQNSAATFMEMLDAVIAVKDPADAS